MESFFPGLFFLSFAAIIILRLGLAAIFLYDAWSTWKALPGRRVFSVGMALLGILIGIGLFTQLAVIAAAIHVTIATTRYQKEPVFGNRAVVVLTFAILLYLLVAGPGGIAFDLPY